MPTPDPVWIYLSAFSVYLLVLAIPGGLLGWAAGLRGWALAGLAPLLTYTTLGLAGPWLSLVNLPFNVGTATAFAVLMGAVIYGIRRLALRKGWASAIPTTPSVTWSRRSHIAVALCVVIATVVSTAVILQASDGLGAVFQRWDTVYHANGMRYIAETADGSLTGMSSLNWYPDGSYYPNAYHLVGALVYSLSGASIPATLSAITFPIAGIFALSLVCLVRQFGGRAMFAGAAALIAGAATTGVYESIGSGLLTFALSVALLPLAAVAIARFLNRPGLDTGMVLVLALCGLLVEHTSAPFGAILLFTPLLLQRWWRREGKPWRDLLQLLAVGITVAVLAAPHLLGAVAFGQSFPAKIWGSDFPLSSSLWQLATFQQVLIAPLVVLSVLLAIGIVTFYRLDRMRWVALSALISSIVFVLVTSYGGTSWVITLSRPWWNDRYRLMALAAIPLCLLAAHGLAEVQRLVSKLVQRWEWIRQQGQRAQAIGLASAVFLASAMAVVTSGFYVNTSARAVALAFYDPQVIKDGKIPVTAAEVAGMQEMGRIAQPGEMVMNDRSDGSVWLYALTGVRTVAAHYDPSLPPPDAAYLAQHFRDYKTDPEVQAAVKRLNIRHVFSGHGTIFAGPEPGDPGLDNLDGLDFLKPVYKNADATIYEIVN